MHTRPADVVRSPLAAPSRAVSPVVARLACAAALALPACAARGNGDADVDDRTHDAFDGVDIGGVFTLEAVEGSPASVRVEGDANLLPLVETRVEDGVLHVTTRERISPTLALVVRVRTPKLREVDVSGAADATITTSQPSFELDVSGASDVTVRGSTQTFELDVSGASEVNASGASEIRYGGGATEVSKDVSGAATIVARP